MEITTKSAEETKKVGEKFAHSFIKEGKNSLIVALVGDLGSGKTTFIQGFASGLAIKQRIISPTYILMRHYKVRHGASHKSSVTDFYHVDLYRLESEVNDEVDNIGLTDIWGKKGNIVMIEWAEKIQRSIPSGAYWININYKQGTSRVINIKRS